MQKFFFSLLLTAVLFFGCKKSETDLPTPIMPGNESQSFTWNHTAGSYWVYQWYLMDSLGNATLHGSPDSIIVLGDTIINGHTFTRFYQDHLIFQPSEFYQRDSSGFIVDHIGNIQFSYNTFNDTVSENEVGGWFINYSVLGAEILEVTVPAGDFNVFQKRIAIDFIDSPPPMTCTDTPGFDRFYDANNGIPVIEQIGYASPYFAICQYYERRLVEFYIAE